VEALISSTIAIGDVGIGIRTTSPAFRALVEQRYAGFVDRNAAPDWEFEVELMPSNAQMGDEDASVSRSGAVWRIARGDFVAEWDPSSRRGSIRQSANPFSLDSVLRIVHTLVLAREGGFLVHAASAVRGGRAYVFAGASGAGKTTIARCAPADVEVLTDEISYVRRLPSGYVAYGTPFAGELARSGPNVHAPLAAIYLLAKGPCNAIEEVGAGQCTRELLSNILFFAQDRELVQSVFVAAVALVESIPVRRLTFRPDARVWDLIA
jgi:hypothetical protein